MSLLDRSRVGVGANARVWDVFVSYARADSAGVDRLVAALEAAGLSVWRDTLRIDTFDGIVARLEEGIANSRIVVACLSDVYPSRPACQWEALQVVRRIPPGQLDSRLAAVALTPGAERTVWPVLSDLHLGTADADGGWGSVAQAVRQRLDLLPVAAAGSAAPIGPAQGRDVLWLPGRPGTSATFTGRFSEMLGLHSLLISDKPGLDTGRTGARLPVGVVGPGGVGKTLLVQEYVNHFTGYWPVVVKLDAFGDSFGHRITGESARVKWLGAVTAEVHRLAGLAQRSRGAGPGRGSSGPAATAEPAVRPGGGSAVNARDLRPTVPLNLGGSEDGGWSRDPLAAARAKLDDARVSLAAVLAGVGEVLWWVDDVPDGAGEDWQRLLAAVPGATDHLRWQEESWIWEPLDRLFRNLGLLPYYPLNVLEEKRALPTGTVRAADYPHPYPDVSDKQVRVIDWPPEA